MGASWGEVRDWDRNPVPVDGREGQRTAWPAFPKCPRHRERYLRCRFFPLMLVWNAGDLKWGTNFGIYAPTGGFTTGKLANTGKNYWTFEPGLNARYLGSTNGFELTGFAGFDVNTKNNATSYQSGSQFHLDVTAAQHLPLFGGLAGVGANLFYYQQINGDSGSGAQLGSFAGMTVGIGPVLSFVYKLGAVNLGAEAKWLPELDTTNRMQGNIAWLKLYINAPF